MPVSGSGASSLRLLMILEPDMDSLGAKQAVVLINLYESLAWTINANLSLR